MFFRTYDASKDKAGHGIPPSSEWIWGGITNWMHPVPVPIVIMLLLACVGSHHDDAWFRSDADAGCDGCLALVYHSLPSASEAVWAMLGHLTPIHEGIHEGWRPPKAAATLCGGGAKRRLLHGWLCGRWGGSRRSRNICKCMQNMSMHVHSMGDVCIPPKSWTCAICRVSKQGFSGGGEGEGVRLGGNKYWRPKLAASGNKHLWLAVSGNKRLL